MKFKVDENLPREAATLLNQAGYDACTVADQSLGGRADHEIATVCRSEQRVLVTMDRGFGDVRHYPPGQSPGILILKSRQQDTRSVVSLLNRVIPMFRTQNLGCELWIVDESGVRIRH
ncbi:MAG: DUF5615 family PIN-like protein [Pirellulales bacterium]|nr:DUF5615 family PIN-like protein [Pirellulales bacterium]